MRTAAVLLGIAVALPVVLPSDPNLLGSGAKFATWTLTWPWDLPGPLSWRQVVAFESPLLLGVACWFASLRGTAWRGVLLPIAAAVGTLAVLWITRMPGSTARRTEREIAIGLLAFVGSVAIAAGNHVHRRHAAASVGGRLSFAGGCLLALAMLYPVHGSTPLAGLVVRDRMFSTWPPAEHALAMAPFEPLLVLAYGLVALVTTLASRDARQACDVRSLAARLVGVGVPATYLVIAMTTTGRRIGNEVLFAVRNTAGAWGILIATATALAACLTAWLDRRLGDTGALGNVFR
jgi:hypothetical protein